MILKFWLFLGPKNFRLYAPVFQSLLRLTYACDLAPNRLKRSWIAKFEMSENFVRLALTVWEIWRAKWQGGRLAPAPIRVKLPFYVKDCVQRVQGKGFSPEYIFICIFKFPKIVKDFLQSVQS